jgi:hypothetical protein
MIEKLRYVVIRGKNIGIVLSPHRYKSGLFRAHKTSSRNDPKSKSVSTELELIELVRLGYKVRMSNVELDHAPSTVRPEIIHV